MMAEEPKSKPAARWRNTLLKGTLWLSSELLFGVIGMDTLADYGEFLMKHRVMDHLGAAIATLTTLM